jgi:hypothetical protein
VVVFSTVYSLILFLLRRLLKPCAWASVKLESFIIMRDCPKKKLSELTVRRDAVTSARGLPLADPQKSCFA